MSKKTYFQNEPIWQLMCIFLVLLGLGCLYIFAIFLAFGISTGFSDENWVGDNIPLFVIVESLFLVGGVICFYEFLMMESFIIHMDHEKIWMKQEKRNKDFRVQFQSKIFLPEIKGMRMIKTNLSSRRKRIAGSPQFVMNKYLVFVKGDKKEVWMNVTHFTDDYLLIIINQIIIQIISSGNSYMGPDASMIIEKYMKEEQRKGIDFPK